jgi:hypothetical protein
MSGATVIGPESQPSVTRIVLVRVPGDPRASNRYLLPQAGAISADLLALGQRLSEPEYVDELIRGFLSAKALDQISALDQARFASALDKSYLTVG